MKIIAISI